MGPKIKLFLYYQILSLLFPQFNTFIIPNFKFLPNRIGFQNKIKITTKTMIKINKNYIKLKIFKSKIKYLI